MVRLENHLSLTQKIPIEKLPAPSRVYIPLSQHIGKVCSPLVKAGDAVSAGLKIGSAEARVFAPVHSSISGKVTAIEDWPHPLLARCKAIVIENDGGVKPTAAGCGSVEEIKNLTVEEIRNIIFEAGIVGMGGAGFPAHIKLSPPKPVDTLIINGAECEPDLSGDSRLMVEKTQEITKGIELAAKCLGVKNIIVAIEDNKPEAISKLQAQGLMVKVLRSEYPQGGERQLVKSILNREVPSGKLPFDIGAVVQNVATIFALYEAVYLGKPLYERVVTVAGSCILHPKNLLAKIGTPIKDLIDFCGLKEKPAKIIIGGPMMGVAQYTTDVPVIKTTTGIILMNKKEAKGCEEEVCIRCGDCVRACPAGLAPCLINLASEKELWKEALAYNAVDCIECGLCNYVCPAKRTLTQSIKRAKLEVEP